ncbi:MAG: hypothetical protein NT120_00845 [Candidatus Aenigmarchaeota archaeon]|nr:hypothetical protein [Candidatus Aenigmarchaeota archaeon]
MAIFNVIDKHWKFLMLITIVFLLFSIGVIANNIVTTGSFMKRDADLSGGRVITVEVNDVDLNKVQAAFPYASVKIASGLTKSLIIEIPFDKDEKEVISQLGSIVQYKGQPNIRIVGPSLGNIFFQQTQLYLIIAFVLMAITVFILFRSPVPASTVLLAAITDIIGTIAVISLIGVALSLPVFVALLTLIGYSVDTDILLTSELLKSGRHNYSESVKKAMKTGLTMTMTTLAALLAMYFVSGSLVIEQIAMVLIIGLCIDMPATWFTNSGFLRFWLERKAHKNENRL